MARRTMPSDGPYKQGDEGFYWHQDSSKFKDKGKWIRGKVLSQEGAMVHIHTDKAVVRINQSKVRRVMMNGMMCQFLTWMKRKKEIKKMMKN